MNIKSTCNWKGFELELKLNHSVLRVCFFFVILEVVDRILDLQLFKIFRRKELPCRILCNLTPDSRMLNIWDIKFSEHATTMGTPIPAVDDGAKQQYDHRGTWSQGEAIVCFGFPSPIRHHPLIWRCDRKPSSIKCAFETSIGSKFICFPVLPILIMELRSRWPRSRKFFGSWKYGSDFRELTEYTRLGMCNSARIRRQVVAI